MENLKMTKADPIASALFEALATSEKCICELKEIIGIPQTWESYDLMMLEDLRFIDSRTVNGHKHFSLAPSRTPGYLRQTMPRVSEFEAALRRGC
jgi:DNA-binding transcriptional ArsR family regulator